MGGRALEATGAGADRKVSETSEQISSGYAHANNECEQLQPQNEYGVELGQQPLHALLGCHWRRAVAVTSGRAGTQRSRKHENYGNAEVIPLVGHAGSRQTEV